jgi:hypothetical protein
LAESGLFKGLQRKKLKKLPPVELAWWIALQRRAGWYLSKASAFLHHLRFAALAHNLVSGSGEASLSRCASFDIPATIDRDPE